MKHNKVNGFAFDLDQCLIDLLARGNRQYILSRLVIGRMPASCRRMTQAWIGATYCGDLERIPAQHNARSRGATGVYQSSAAMPPACDPGIFRVVTNAAEIGATHMRELEQGHPDKGAIAVGLKQRK
jgi:hypothetical protein